MKLENGKLSKTPGERFLSWAKGLSVIVAACLAIYAAFAGNKAQDGVDKNYDTLAEQVNKQNKVINAQSEKLERLTRRMMFFQGHQAGFSAGQLYEQKVTLEKQLDELRAKKIPPSVSREQIVEILRGARPKPSKASKQPATSGDTQQIQKLAPMPLKPAWGK